MATRTNPDERLTRLDDHGNVVEPWVGRAEAHRLGIPHRAVSIFVINRRGEVLLQRRSKHKDLFPNCYDLAGGHVLERQSTLQAAVQEIKEELGLDLKDGPDSRLELLGTEHGVIEHVTLPDRGIINNERKTIYLLELTPSEEVDVLRLATLLLRLTSRELEERGTSGESSAIEFWPWERLLEVWRSSGYRPLASGVQSALRDDSSREGAARRCLSRRTACRNEFAAKYSVFLEKVGLGSISDQALFDLFLERPVHPASRADVGAIFERGSAQPAGAYELGRFRQVAAGDDHWEAKLRDPETRYVRNLVTALGFGQPVDVQRRLDHLAPEIQDFVRDLRNYPLSDGTRFQDGLGNLADIAAARKGVLLWLQHVSPPLPQSIVLESPTGVVTQLCLTAGRELAQKAGASRAGAGLDRFRHLVLMGLGASSADFNNPDFQALLKSRSVGAAQIGEFLDSRTTTALNPELGGDHFLLEFYTRFVESSVPCTIAYLAGNAAQGCLSMAIAAEILRANARASVCFVTKSASPGNDLTFEDALAITTAATGQLFPDLARFQAEGRFILESDGPQCHGLDPGRLSANTAKVLSNADVILAEGQAYAEICGWRKPTYIAFRVNGRVAEAIHGISRKKGALGFVRLTPGVDHFQDFQAAVRRTVTDPTRSRIPAAGQTTAEYVRAILGENLSLIVRHLFQDDHAEACQRISSEATALGVTFAQVLTGAASESPDPELVAQAFADTRYDVFACGGGGGFSAVTLRALRMLELPAVAGVPSTDDGGNTGDLQRWLRRERGFVFGVGDMAAILQDALPNRGKQALLAYRFDEEPASLTSAIIAQVANEVSRPTDPAAPIGAAPGFLSFACDQLNFARVIQKRFRGDGRGSGLPLKGASVRNLNVIAAYELCGVLGDREMVRDESRLAPFYVLQRALGLPSALLVVPASYTECVLFTDYGNPIPEDLAREYSVPEEAISHERRRLYGQQYIDKLPHAGPRVLAGVLTSHDSVQRPRGNPEYLARMRQAKLFVMGAGSLIGSQLSQLAIPGVVDVLLERSDMRRILVLNHVKMDETLGMALRDQVRLIEATAAANISRAGVRRFGASWRLRISDIFTDIVVPRTIAKEIEAAMLAAPSVHSASSPPQQVDVLIGTGEVIRVPRNEYTQFLLDDPDFCQRYQLTAREVEVLSHLTHPAARSGSRREAGRYRGALFATTEDIDYLEGQGIQRRRIHEVDCVGKNWKFVKAAGTPSLEFFPGLVPEALVGIFRIALEQASPTSQT